VIFFSLFLFIAYYGILLVIKGQRVKNVPNRQLHATANSSKLVPDPSEPDQGEGERGTVRGNKSKIN
jgi:hypothetical protein